MSSPTVLVLPYPAQGHVNPLMTFSKKLADNGCKVFFVNTDYNHKRVLVSSSSTGEQEGGKQETDVNIKMVSIPDGLRPEDDRNDFEKLSVSMLNTMPAMLEKLIEDIHSKGQNRINCIIADMSMGWALDVAKKLGINGVLFWLASAALFAVLHNVPKLIDDGVIDSHGLPTTDEKKFQISPNMPKMDTRALFWLKIADSINHKKIVFNYMMQCMRNLDVAKWWLCNSTHENEPGPLSFIPKLLPVGPLLTTHHHNPNETSPTKTKNETAAYGKSMDSHYHDNPLFKSGHHDKSKETIAPGKPMDSGHHDNPLFNSGHNDKPNETIAPRKPMDSHHHDNPLFKSGHHDKPNETNAPGKPMDSGHHDNPLFKSGHEDKPNETIAPGKPMDSHHHDNPLFKSGHHDKPNETIAPGKPIDSHHENPLLKSSHHDNPNEIAAPARSMGSHHNTPWLKSSHHDNPNETTASARSMGSHHDSPWLKNSHHDDPNETMGSHHDNPLLKGSHHDNLNETVASTKDKNETIAPGKSMGSHHDNPLLTKNKNEPDAPTRLMGSHHDNPNETIASTKNKNETATPARSMGQFWEEDLSSLSWLDKQPKRSVLYVAFGSVTQFDQTQFKELALGLDLTDRPFLWVVRKDHNCPNKMEFPNEFLGSKGKIIGWAPQQKVLSHPAIAGFVSHCGWNSTMEGLSNGVPFLCWPYFADQFYDKSYICDDLKCGLGLDSNDNGLVSRYEIKKKVDQLLGDEKIKSRSLELKEKVMRDIAEGGRSSKNLSKFVKWLNE
ncbi:UDP-glucuronosyl/UDP-glucosyltransferase [Sesbania bispinosa]|nr:UDP-glucuronosyl/UDP-glucosyltransferase [Sesbania bispinosa]